MYSTDLLSFFTADRTILTIEELPELSLTLQGYNIPGVGLASPTQNTPIVNIPLVGDKIVNEDITLEFLVSADLKNWLTARNWIVSNADPKMRGTAPLFTYTDALLTAYNATNNPIGSMKLINCVPVNLSGISSSTKTTETTPVTAALTLQFERLEIDFES